MKKIFKSHRILALALALALVVVLGVVAIAAAYSLDKTIPSTVTINAVVPPPVEVTLYTDALCTNPIPANYVHAFGVYDEGATPQNPLWFKAAEVTPSSIAVTDDESAFDVQFLVGTPLNSMPGKPCTLALWLPNTIAPGAYTFNMTVTGTGP